jgi:hypothetical protein
VAPARNDANGDRHHDRMGDDVSDQPGRTPIDTGTPHSARVWNYLVGGTDNFPVDRAAGDALAVAHPTLTTVAGAFRAFLRRTVRFLATEAGIRQFLDIGSGLPTAGNVHQVAQRCAPRTRVVYVDHDPRVHLHTAVDELLDGAEQGVAHLLDADMYDPGGLLKAAAEILDLDRPIAVTFYGVLGHICDLDEARDLVRYLMDRTCPGSHLVVGDASEIDANATIRRARLTYGDVGAVPYLSRSPEEIESFFEGMDWVAPGFTSLSQWRPDPGDDPPPVGAFGGVGCRR